VRQSLTVELRVISPVNRCPLAHSADGPPTKLAMWLLGRPYSYAATAWLLPIFEIDRSLMP
jgi:hypothetical protein